jgi:peptidyl-prolyl cis-trans isomerase B (cyclophilin B)
VWQAGGVKKTILILLGAGVLLAGCSTPVPAAPAGSTTAAAPATSAATSAPAASEAAGGTVSCAYPADGAAAKKVDPPSTADVPATGTVAYTLTLNDTPLALTLDREAAPCTVHSFESLAAQGYFDDTACHRLVDSGIFVLQCGDPSGTGSGGPGYAFADELDKTTGYPAGTIAMANAGADTNGSQFFIVYADSPLPNDYTVFGTLDDAAVKVITELAAKGQDNTFGAAGGGKPNAPAVITSVVAA